MKKILIALSLIVAFAACGSDNGNKTNGPSPIELQTSFAPNIKGVWVLTDYVDDLGKTKSPKASSDKLQGIVSMDIDPEIVSGDSAIVSASLNNHEGYTFYLMYRQGQDDRSLVTAHTDPDNSDNFYELGYTTENGENMVTLNHYDKDKKLLDKRTFTKVTGPQSDNGEPYSLTYMANKILFSGSYSVTDEHGKTTEATFSDDGLVSGIGDHTTYYVFTDFIGDEETNLDEMLFDEHTKNQKGYIFEISGDTTRLYRAMENDDRTQLIRGELKYTMVKK
ncbi:MAG: hypothetical protein H6550_15585 [Chitinophagales bacterium]|nr:hypothetical protein [Chitinophagales bacterium]